MQGEMDLALCILFRVLCIFSKRWGGLAYKCVRQGFSGQVHLPQHIEKMQFYPIKREPLRTINRFLKAIQKRILWEDRYERAKTGGFFERR